MNSSAYNAIGTFCFVLAIFLLLAATQHVESLFLRNLFFSIEFMALAFLFWQAGTIQQKAEQTKRGGEIMRYIKFANLRIFDFVGVAAFSFVADNSGITFALTIGPQAVKQFLAGASMAQVIMKASQKEGETPQTSAKKKVG